MSHPEKLTSENGKHMLSARAVAKRLDCDPDYVGKLCRENKLQGQRINGAWFITEDSLGAYEAARQLARRERSETLSNLRKQESERYRKVSREPVAPAFKKVFYSVPFAASIFMLCAVLVFGGTLSLPESMRHSQTTSGESLAAALNQVESPFFGTRPVSPDFSWVGAQQITNAFANFFALLFGSGSGNIAQTPVPPDIQETAPSVPSAPQIPAIPPQTIVNNTYPVVERIVERTAASGDWVSANALTLILAEMHRSLRAEMSRMIGATLDGNFFSGGGGSSGGGGGGLSLADLIDANIPDTITVSNYLPLAGGTLTGALDNTSLETSTFAGPLSLDHLTVGTTTATSTFAGGLEVERLETSATSSLAGIKLTNLDCSGFNNSGKLTVDADGNVICANDISSVGGGAPGGSGGQVQFNDGGGDFAGDASFTFDTVTSRVNITNLVAINSTTTQATTTALHVSGTLSLANALTVVNGGTGSGAIQAGSILFGNGTNPLATSTALQFDSALSKLTVINASTTNISANTAAFGGTGTTSVAQDGSLTIQNLSGLLKATAGLVSTAVAGTDYVTPSGLASAYPFGLPGNATSTLTQFNGGLTAFASSTIGAGGQTTGLTISGGATTTGNSLVQGSQTISGSLTLGTALTVSNGGTGQTSFTAGQLLYGSGSGALQSVATGTVSGSSQISVTAGQSIIGSGLTLGIVVDSIGDTELAFDTGQHLTTASTPTFSALTITNTLTSGSLATGNASTTNISANTAAFGGTGTTSVAQDGSLTIQNLSGLLKATAGLVSAAVAGTDYVIGSGSSGNCVQWGASNSLTDTGAPCGSGGGSAYPFGLPGNATSTLTQFNGGLTAFASSTIGAGGQTTGLTISGGATTTGNSLVQGSQTVSGALGVAGNTTLANATTTALAITSLGTPAGTLLAVNPDGSVVATSTPSSGVTAIGPANQTADGPTVTLSTTTAAFNGLTSVLTITGSGDTLQFAPTLSGSLGDAGIDDNITISGGTIGSNSISGTLTTTGTLTIGDGGDRIDINSDSWDVTNGAFTGITSLTASGIGTFGGLLSTASSTINASTTITGILTASGGIFGNVTGNLTGTASLATALAANGTNCSSGQAPLGVDAQGNVESCFDVWTEAENAAAGYARYPFPDTGNATSTLTQFNGGLTAFASSTIGAGGQTTGLTISGGATTTGNAYFGGRVGIGTMNPSAATSLEVTGNGIRVSHSSGTALLDLVAESTYANIYSTYYSGQDVPLYLGTDTNKQALTIQADTGNVGIGNTNPLQKLNVQGITAAQALYATSTAVTSLFSGGLSVTGTTTLANATTTALAITSLTNTLLSTNATGGVVATTSVGTNYLTGTLGTINNTAFDVGSSITITAASSTLLSDNNSFTAHNIFSSLFATAASTTHATTTSLHITGLSQVPLYVDSAGRVQSAGSGSSGNCVQWGASNTLTDAGAPCGSGGGSAYPFGLPGNATSTLTQFNGGLTAFASSTIGNGTAAGGLTVFGTATTTNLFVSNNALIQGSATTSNLDITGLFTFGGITSSTWSDFCISITGGAGLCDGVDSTGSGGSGLATSTDISDTWIIYGTSENDVGAEAAFTYDDATNKLTVVNASTTALSVSGTASTTNLIISGVLSSLLSTNSTGVVGSPTISAPLSFGANTLSISQAGSGSNGYLSSSDWNIFNNKISSTSLSGESVISYNSSTGVITTTPGTFAGSGSSVYVFPGDLIVTGNSTTTNATTTNLYVSSAFRGAGLSSCSDSVSDKLIWDSSTGQFDCASDAGSSGVDANWTTFNGIGLRTTQNGAQVIIGGTSTSTLSKLEVVGGAVFDNATTTGFRAEGIASFGGNLGIGTTTPSQKFTVAGGTILQTASGNPTLATSTFTTGQTYSSYVVGRYAYVAANAGGLRILDVTNPSSPVAIGAFSLGAAQSVVVAGRYAYVSDGSTGLNIIDVSNPVSPTLVSATAGAGSANTLALSGKYLYVPDVNGGSMKVVDISDPTAPVIVSSTLTGGTPYAIAVMGKYVYVADQTDATLYVFDASNPATPALVDTLDDFTMPSYIYISGRYLYLTDGADGLFIIDNSDPTDLNVIGTYNVANYYAVQVAGNYAYLADIAGNVVVLDVSTPTTPIAVGSLAVGNTPRGLTLAGKYAYVSTNSDTLEIVDINGTQLPAAHIGSLESNQLNVSETLTVGGDIYAGGGLNVGLSGIFSRGGLGVLGTTTLTDLFASRATTTNATTTTLFAQTASSTNLFTSNLSVGTLTGLLKATAGLVSAAIPGTDYLTSVDVFAFPFNPTVYGVSTSTTVGFENGLLSTASSTFTSTLTLSSLANSGLAVNAAGQVYASATTTFSGGLTYLNGNVTCDTASGSTLGCLSAADWTTFNEKVSSSSLFSVVASAYPFGLPGNATSTLTQFNGGLTAFASSTIGNGTQAGGLTISGGATTTGILRVLGSGGNFPVTLGANGSNILWKHPSATMSGRLNQRANNEIVWSGNVDDSDVIDNSSLSAFKFGIYPPDNVVTFQNSPTGNSTWNGGTNAFINLNTGLWTFNHGLRSLASTTIGSGTQAGGLTIFGGATTTGNAYFVGNVGIGNTNPLQKLNVQGIAAAQALYATSSAITSMFSGGLSVTGTTTLANATTTALAITSLGTPAGTLLAVNPDGSVVATSTPSSGVTAIGPANQTADGPTVTLSTTTAAFNGLTSVLTITGSGDTLQFAPTLSGSLGDAGIDDNITISGGTIGSNSISGTLTTTGTLTIGDGGDRIDINSDSWDVTNGAFTGITSLTASGIGTFGGLLSTASSTINASTTITGILTASGGIFGNVTGNLTGTASLATALAANGTNCSSGQAPLGVDAQGNVESCFDVWTEAENAAAGYARYPFPDTGNATSTLTQFNGGLTAFASSTIGNGTAAGGLTVSGTATTTNLVVSGNTTLQTITSALVVTGATGLVAEYAGTSCTNQFVRSLSALGAATCATVTSADVDSSIATFAYPFPNNATSTTLTFNSGLISNGNVGIGTTSPYANLSIHANNGETNTTLFAIASSTANSTTTLFAVSNTGAITVGDANSTGDSIFQFGGDPNAWTMGYYAADKSFRIASSTDLDSNVAFSIAKGGNGTTTLSGLNINGSATTTSNVGIDLSDGCFAVDGTCIFSGASAITAIGPTGQTADGPTVTLASSSAAFNGLTPSLTITGSGDTLTFASALTGSLGDGGIDNNITVTGGTLGNNSVSGTWTTTGTLTIGDGGDRIDVDSDTWDVTNGAFTGLTSLTASGIGTFGGLLSTASSTINASTTITGILTASGGIFGNLTGTASLATALAANGTNCNAGEYALGVDASGNAEGCTDATTEIAAAVGASYPFSLAGNATSTLTQFNGGLTAYASSTIGDGVNGLTVNGTATTTGRAYFGGNVGIGTSTPQSSLQVESTNINPGILTSGAQVALLSNSAQAADRGGVLGFGGIYTSGGATRLFGAIAGRKENSTGANQAGYLAFYTNANGSMNEVGRFDSAGNFGIGTSTPYAKLSVEGSSALGNSALAGYFVATTTTASQFPYASSTAITVSGTASTTNLVISSVGASAGQCLTINSSGLVSTQTCSNFAYPFGLAGNATSTLTQFNGGLTSYASTTIGGGTALTGLTISGAATTTGNALFQGNVTVGSSGRILLPDGSAGSPSLSFTNDTDTGLYFTSGNLGLVADGNVQAFVLNGTIRGTNNDLFSINSGSARSATTPTYSWRNDENTGLGSAGADTLSLITGGSERIRITSTGNVGIGTTSPYAKLSVEGSSALGNSALAGYFIATTTTASQFPYASTTAISVSGSASTTALVVSGLGASAGQCLTTNSAGQVTSQACGGGGGSAYPFDLPGNATSTLTQFNGGLTAFASSTIGAGGQTTGLTISGGATTTLNAYFASKVGIGTTSPSFKLSVTDAVATAQQILAYDNGNFATLLVNATGDLVVHASGGDVTLSNDNLFVCQGGSCPTTTATSTAGNLFVENAVTIGSGWSLREIDSSNLGLYDTGGKLILIFDEGT